MSGRRRFFDSFKMRLNSFIENLSLKDWPGTPPTLSRKGHLWYNSNLEAGYIAEEEDGILYPRRIMTNKPRWVNITTPMVAGTTSVTGNPTWEEFVGDISALVFNDEVLQTAQCTFTLPHNYAIGTDVFPYIHWTPKAPNETGVVRWCFDIIAANGYGKDAFTDPVMTMAVEQSANGVTLEHLTSETDSGFYDPKLEPDTVVICKVYRDGAHPNDTAGEVFGLVAGLHVQVDDIGAPHRGPNFFSS